MPTTVTLFSDFACPFCFIVEQSSLIRLQETHDVTVLWRGFEFSPRQVEGDPPTGRIFMAEEAAWSGEHVAAIAREFGINEMTFPDRVPNTQRALVVAEFARDAGRLDIFRRLAMNACWRQGLDLEDRSVLRQLIDEAGLDRGAAYAAPEDPVYLERMDDTRCDFLLVGGSSIPAFFIEDELVATGCASHQELAAAVDRFSAPGARTTRARRG